MGNRASSNSNAVQNSTPQNILSSNPDQEEETDASGVFIHKTLLGKENKILSCLFLTFDIFYMYSSKISYCITHTHAGNLAAEFQNALISEEWKERQQRILTMGHERVQKEEQAKATLHNEWSTFQQMNNLRQTELDRSIDNYTKSFIESESVTRYSISKMEDEMAVGKENVLPTVSYIKIFCF